MTSARTTGFMTRQSVSRASFLAADLGGSREAVPVAVENSMTDTVGLEGLGVRQGWG